MRFKILLCALLLIMAITVFGAEDKFSVDYKNMPVATAINSLFQQTDKNFVLSPYIQNGYINVKMTDKPFDTILSAILKQVNATFEFKDGTYYIDPSNNTRNGMMGGGMNNPMGGMNDPMGGGMNNPMMGGGMGNMGAGTGMGMGRNQMGGGMMGMNGTTTQTKEAAPWEKEILKIPVKYNSPNQILSLMDGDDYIDVVYYGSGSSGSSNNNSNSSSSSSSSSSNSSSRSSSSSNR